MKKDKRGLALITAIAVLALMLILFGGLASVYSAQVSRGKVELEQSQAMLMAQSYAEMLDQVLTSTNGEADGLKEKLGEIRTGKEVVIESDLTQPQNVIDAKVKITATAEKASTSGNTTTRKIKIKVSATVDDETRSIDLDYTFKKVTGGGVMDYAVYGNTVDYYDTENHYEKKDNEQYRQEVIFSDDWYHIKSFTKPPFTQEEITNNLDEMNGKILYKYGKVEGEEKLFTVKKDGIINPLDSDFSTFSMAVNKNDSSAELPLWSGLYEPDDTVPVCTTEITASCIWDSRLDGRINVTASIEDIIIYMPIDEELELESTDIYFFNGATEESEAYQLYIYIYSTGNAEKIDLEDTLKIANNENGGRSNFLDIFVICNDEIEIEVSEPKDGQMVLEAYFYFPKGTVLLEAEKFKSTDNNYFNRIRGCLVADEIIILGHDNSDKKLNRVGVDYVPPREIQGGGSSKTTFTYKLNSYEEGGKS